MTEEAARAAFFEVTFFGALVWERALPAEVFDLDPVDLLRRVFDALPAAFGLVTLDFAISLPPFFHFNLNNNAKKRIVNSIIKFNFNMFVKQTCLYC